MKRALIAAAFALAFPAAAHAEAEGPTGVIARIAPPPGLEKVAEEYWADRGVAVPTPMTLYEINNESGAAGWGEEPGTDVFMPKITLYVYPRSLLCAVYIHERGHNAGLSHASPDPEMSPTQINVPPKCAHWSREYMGTNDQIRVRSHS